MKTGINNLNHFLVVNPIAITSNPESNLIQELSKSRKHPGPCTRTAFTQSIRQLNKPFRNNDTSKILKDFYLYINLGRNH